MDAFKRYLEAIKGCADFRDDPARTARLVSRMRGGDRQAKEDVVISTLKFIASLAATHCRKMNAWRDMEDLVQEANERVATSIDNFDPSKSSLERFVRFRAKFAFIDYWYRVKAVNYTDYRRSAERLVKRAKAELASAFGQEPTVEELAEHLDMDEARVRDYMTPAVISFADIPPPGATEEGPAGPTRLALPSQDKSPYQLAEAAEMRDIALRCLGREDAELLLSYLEHGTAYFKEMHFRLRRTQKSDQAARQYVHRLVLRLRACLRKVTRLSARGGNNEPQATYKRHVTQRIFKG